MNPLRLPHAIAASIVLVPGLATAQCMDFVSGFGTPGVGASSATANIAAQVVFDDGNGHGNALYVAGSFDVAGDISVRNIARWDGQFWSSIGDITLTGSAGDVAALVVHDVAGSDEIYAGGTFDTAGGVGAKNIARWNGSNWSPLAQGLTYSVRAMVAFDDGTGSKLYVACSGAGSGPGFTSRLAVWDGAGWTNIEPSNSGALNALEVFDDGISERLYLGGASILAGGTLHSLLAWTGSSWVDVGGGVMQGGTHGTIHALKSYDNGSGPALYVAGQFTTSGGGFATPNIARWNGTTWSALGLGPGATVTALGVFDDGSGAALYASANSLMRWRSNVWSLVGSPGVFGSRSFAVFDDQSGSVAPVFIGGSFHTAGSIRAESFVRWNGTAWSALGAQQGLNGAVSALGSWSSEVLAVGSFTYGGATSTGTSARWNGAVWSSSVAPSTTRAFEHYDDGTGDKLFAVSPSLSCWDGTQWTAVPGAPNGLNALTTFDDGVTNALWVGGTFTSVNGTPAKSVARWDGTTWFAMPTGPNVGGVQALAGHDDGSGPALYIGGTFAKIGTMYVHGIARWNGMSWSQVGDGFSAAVNRLCVFDDGSGIGPQLYAAGDFGIAWQSTLASRIARWDGVAWQPLGAGLNGSPLALEVFNDGAGEALFVGGSFTSAGGLAVANLARWSGSSWSPVAGGINGAVNALMRVDGTIPGSSAMWIGGQFTTAGATSSSYIARLENRCPCPPRSYCTAGTSSNGCVPTLGAIGRPSATGASSFIVTASNLEGQKLGLIFYGMSGTLGVPWLGTSSFLCVKPPQQRTTQSSSGGTNGVCNGIFALDWNTYVNLHPAALGQPFSAGDHIWLQGWYRDPPSSKTTALTDALEVLVCP